jgi:hypothetical protein
LTAGDIIMRIRHIAFTAAAIALCAIIPTHAYVLNGPRWAASQVPYYINPANLDVSASAAEAAVQAGMATWGTQSNANFSFYYMGRTSGTSLTNNGKNEIFFRNTSAGSMAAETHWWYDGSNHLIDADIVLYDGGFTFFTGSSGCSGGVYIEDIVAHEGGHALGLGHSSVASATMYPSISWCSTALRTLDADDLAGVETLYPPSGATSTTNTAPSVTITAPTSGSSFAAGASVTLTGTASDSQDGTLSSSIVWRSNIDGQLGVGGSVTKALSSGNHTVTATTTDSAGATATAQIAVTIASTTITSGNTSVVLWANGRKVKGSQRADLSWAGATSVYVDVYRNGARVMTTANDGTQTDMINKKGGGSYTYQLCEAGTSVCSASVVVTF